VTSSLLVSKIQSSKGISLAANPLSEYGYIEKKIHILKYISDEGYQRKIGKQLKKDQNVGR
ncbi:MAG: Tn3 family transposase, partial [Oligoflexia bacterium]|nr:Tn3 family transposase [Oligoflexia bacterium]